MLLGNTPQIKTWALSQMAPCGLPLSQHFHAALTVGLKSAVKLAPLQARQKCGSRAHSSHKGGTREHPSDCKNYEWDTLRSCGLNGHVHSAAIVSPQVQMMCSIWDNELHLKIHVRWKHFQFVA